MGVGPGQTLELLESPGISFNFTSLFFKELAQQAINKDRIVQSITTRPQRR
ncbi:hypothetical protein LguiB_013196 [Lonicera macranthoides]